MANKSAIFHGLNKAVLFLAAAFAFSCSATKDRKAIGRVMSNPDLIARVGKLLPPCSNDTTIISDTVTNTTSTTIYDTTVMVVNDTVTKVVTKKEVVERWNTKTLYVTDNRALDAQRDTTAKYVNAYITKDAEAKQAANKLAISEQKNATRRWAIIALILALILSNAGWAFVTFKK